MPTTCAKTTETIALQNFSSSSRSSAMDGKKLAGLGTMLNFFAQA
jgi:hypothetical protein